MSVAVAIRVEHEPGAAAIDAAVPAIAGAFIEQACNAIDATLQALGCQGVRIGVDVTPDVELEEPTE